MVEQLRKKRAEQGGFTLIELLIVIIILGILAAIVVFAVGTTRKDSVTSSCKTDAKSIELSLESQLTKNGGYPATQADGADATKGALLKNWPAPADYDFTYVGTGTANGDGTFPGYKVTIGTTNKVKGGNWTNGDDSTLSDPTTGGCLGK
jgi:prepilin-type N-terminal cleavage/methylation domain-containing protein